MKGSHFFSYQDQTECLGLWIIILQGVSSRKSLAGVNIMVPVTQLETGGAMKINK
jgi:hypothetical protein